MINYFVCWFVGAFIFGAIEYFVMKLRGKKLNAMDKGVAVCLILLSWVSIIIMVIAMGIDYFSYDPNSDDDGKEDYEETV